MTQPKLILIGAGNIAQAHVEAFRLAGTDVVGVCTRSDRGQIFAEQHNIPHFSQSISDLVNTTQPDGALILTQPSAYEAVLAELKPFKLPVLLEKPFGMTVAEGTKLKPLLPTKAMMAHNRRFYGHVQVVVKELQTTEKPMVATLILPEREKDVAHRDDITRNAWPMLNHIHGIDLCRYLTGDLATLHTHQALGELTFSCHPRYTSAVYTTNRGHLVNFVSNLDSPGGWRLHVLREKEEVIFSPFEQGQRKTMTGVSVIEPSTDADTQAKPGFLAQAQCFLAGLASETLPANWVTVDDALASMALVEALYPRLVSSNS